MNIQQAKKENREIFSDDAWLFVRLPAHCVRFSGLDKDGNQYEGEAENMEELLTQAENRILQGVREEVRESKRRIYSGSEWSEGEHKFADDVLALLEANHK